MTKQFETRCVTLISNGRGGWNIYADGILDCRDYSELEMEGEIEKLLLDGWLLVGSVNHKPFSGSMFQRDLYFRREIPEKAT